MIILLFRIRVLSRVRFRVTNRRLRLIRFLIRWCRKTLSGIILSRLTKVLFTKIVRIMVITALSKFGTITRFLLRYLVIFRSSLVVLAVIRSRLINLMPRVTVRLMNINKCRRILIAFNVKFVNACRRRLVFRVPLGRWRRLLVPLLFTVLFVVLVN